jgi:hypothetical protein
MFMRERQVHHPSCHRQEAEEHFELENTLLVRVLVEMTGLSVASGKDTIQHHLRHP